MGVFVYGTELFLEGKGNEAIRNYKSDAVVTLCEPKEKSEQRVSYQIL